MNIRRKRIIIPTAAVVAALGIGGGVWATAAQADVSGGERDRAAAAAVQAVPGTAIDVEAGDDDGAAYEVEVRRQDGTEVDVTLDKSLQVIAQDADDAADDAGTPDRALTAAERASAEQAAKGAVSGGTVLSVEASDGGDAAYEAEVRGADNKEWDVELDAAVKLLRTTADD